MPFLRHARDIRSLLQLRAFDTSSGVGRSKERYRRAIFTAFTVGSARALSLLTVVIAVPLSLAYLGSERYGLWAVVISFTAFLNFADLGLGNGLLNAISEAHGREDPESARKFVSSAFFVLVAVALVLGGVLAVVYTRVDWAAVFNVETAPAQREAGPAFAVLAASVLVSMPLGVTERIQLGYQEGFFNGGWAFVGGTLSLAGVVVGVLTHAGVPWLVLAVTGGPVVGLVANGTLLFGRRRPWLRPRLAAFSREAAGKLFRLGLLFVIPQVAGAIALTSDVVVADRLFGASSVTEYSIPMRLFTITPLVLVLLFSPLWPAYREALMRHDATWVRNTLRRTLVLATAVTGLTSSVLVAAGPWIVRHWSRGQVSPSFTLLAGFGIWAVLASVAAAMSTFLNAINAIRIQVFSAVLVVTVGLAFKIALGDAFGLPGIIWGAALSYAVFSVGLAGVYIKRLVSLPDLGVQRMLPDRPPIAPTVVDM